MLLFILLLAATGAAQPLTVSNRLLQFPCDWGAELWASTNLKSWSRLRVFTNQTPLPVDGGARFFRAVPRTEPVKILSILDLRQTIRGHADKDVTNIVAVGEGGTYKGWVQDVRMHDLREDATTNAYGNLVPGPNFGRTKWSHFRLPPMPGNTNVVLTITDDHGFSVRTNLVLDPTQPSDYKYQRPAGRRGLPSAPLPGSGGKIMPGLSEPPPVVAPTAPPPLSGGFAPAGDPIPSWYIRERTTTYAFTSVRRHDGLLEETSFSEKTNDDESWLRLRTFRAYGLNIYHDCVQHYDGGGEWQMALTYVDGNCYAPPFRSASINPEMASYHDTSSTYGYNYTSERMVRSASTRVTVEVGDRGTGDDAVIRVGATWYKMHDRYMDDLGEFQYATTTWNGTYSVPDGSAFSVTPVVPTTGDWYQFWMVLERLQ